jgi:hypothetical protein
MATELLQSQVTSVLLKAGILLIVVGSGFLILSSLSHLRKPRVQSFLANMISWLKLCFTLFCSANSHAIHHSCNKWSHGSHFCSLVEILLCPISGPPVRFSLNRFLRVPLWISNCGPISPIFLPLSTAAKAAFVCSWLHETSQGSSLLDMRHLWRKLFITQMINNHCVHLNHCIHPSSLVIYLRRGGGHYATSWKVEGSIPHEVTGFFNWHNPSSHAMALGSTQPLTDISTRNPPGCKGWPVRKADSLTAICELIV